MASESQTTVSPSTRHGTRPEGENFLKPGLPFPSKRWKRSSNGMASSVRSAQGRSDHDE